MVFNIFEKRINVIFNYELFYLLLMTLLTNSLPETIFRVSEAAVFR